MKLGCLLSLLCENALETKCVAVKSATIKSIFWVLVRWRYFLMFEALDYVPLPQIYMMKPQPPLVTVL